MQRPGLTPFRKKMQGVMRGSKILNRTEEDKKGMVFYVRSLTPL
jgi:hypothetical protein